MAKFTKHAIMQAFMELLNTTSFDKITVKDIVDKCGINRNTFYYNFEDIYALVDEILQDEVKKIAEIHRPFHSWNEALLSAADFALQNKKAIFHLHNSVKRSQLDKYSDRVIHSVVLEFVQKEAEGENVSDTDTAFIAGFYGCALLGLLNHWLDNGMEADFTEVINKTGILFNSNIKQAIHVLAEQSGQRTLSKN